MAEPEGQSGQSSNSWLTPVLIIGGAVLLVTILAVALGAGWGGVGGGNDVRGASVTQPIDPLKPEDRVLIQKLKDFANPTLSISERKKSLPDLLTNIDKLIQSNDKNPNNSADVKAQIDSHYQKIKNLLTQISSGSSPPANLSQLLASIGTEAQAVLDLGGGSGTYASVTGSARRDTTIQMGIRMTQENVDSNYQKYDSTLGSMGPNSFDCSGFMSFLLEENKVIPKSVGHLATDEGATWPGNHYLQLPASEATLDKLNQLVQSGTLQPGDIIVAHSSDIGYYGHSMMFVGGNDPKKVIINSPVNNVGKGSLQFRSLRSAAAVFRDRKDIIYFIRPNY